jgi:hypothetical protein
MGNNMEDLRMRTESRLEETPGGFALLDALAQANIDPSSLLPEQLERLLGQSTRSSVARTAELLVLGRRRCAPL